MCLRDRLDVKCAQLMVIDFQERLLPAIADHESVLSRAVVMIEAARILALPALWTEQYVKGLGPTDARIAEPLLAMNAQPIEKMTFSSCGILPVRERLDASKRKQIIVVGIEAHVCVQQTVLELLAMGYQPWVLADAIGSRQPRDYEAALHRMRQAGAIVTTTEAAVFELLREAGTDSFKSVLKIIK